MLLSFCMSVSLLHLSVNGLKLFIRPPDIGMSEGPKDIVVVGRNVSALTYVSTWVPQKTRLYCRYTANIDRISVSLFDRGKKNYDLFRH